MGRRARRVIGITTMTVFVIGYIAVAMVVGAENFADVGPLPQLLYFVVAGIAWTIPAALIIKWMRAGGRD